MAGPITFLVLLFATFPVAFGQTYIDVEAERRAAQTNPPVQSRPPTSGGAVSYGSAAAPAGVTRSLPPPAAPNSDNIGGLFNQVQQLQQEVMRLNGLVEQQAYELRLLKEQSLERYVDLDSRLASGGAGAAQLADGSGGSPTTDPGIGSGANTPARSVAEQPGESDAYGAAYALVRGQEFDRAVDAFVKFLQAYPDGRYAPNAHYWMGELYLVIDPVDAEAARQSFMLLLNQYPNHSKIPDALYKLGRVHFIKGNNRRAREYLSRVMGEYPKSSAARLASDFIDQNL
ncbi:MAG: tol-pal system protein YbgF [Congregibacter sp.]